MQEIVDITNNELPENNKYVLHIENFEGPLDLLWELIKKSKIDIAEISISQITEQYVAFLKLMKDLNFKIAIEFIWMASELLYYKSKALLPTSELEDEYFVPPLPPELIQKLLEYKKFQQASNQLLNKYNFHSDSFARLNKIEDLPSEEVYLNVSLFDLLKAFADVLEFQKSVEYEEIVFDEILVSDKIEFITELLKEQEFLIFEAIFSAKPTRAEIVASFLAVLEMTKTKMIKLVQHRSYGDIRIIRNYTLEDM